MDARRFAIGHAIGCLRELTRYLRVGIVAEELIADIAIATETFGLRAVELGGGDC